MTFDELEELMQEPPGGENHGRVRTSGGWRSLQETYETDLPYIIVDPEYRATTSYEHGTLAKYNHGRCRCERCRRAMREYRRSRRRSS